MDDLIVRHLLDGDSVDTKHSIALGDVGLGCRRVRIDARDEGRQMVVASAANTAAQPPVRFGRNLNL